MICTPNAVMSRPVRTSLAKPSQICGRSSIALPAMARSSVVDICGPPCGGRDQQEPGEPDRERDHAGEQQRGLGADRADQDAAERQRAQLGAVAGGVVDAEGAAADRLADALVDQRAHEYV